MEHFDERAETLPARLKALAKRLFCDNNCLFSFAGSQEDYERFWRAEPTCGRTGDMRQLLEIPKPTIRNEAFVVPSDVCFAAMGWDHRLLAQHFTGTWAVAGRALSLDYLWNEVRVKGGAYGVGFQALRSGNMRFYSYRDPHLDETLKRFEGSPAWLAGFEPSDEEFEGFVVASVAKIDAPRKPHELIRKQAGNVIAGRKPDEYLETRRQIVATDLATMREFAGTLEEMIQKKAICVFGSRDILESSQAGFELVNLVG